MSDTESRPVDPISFEVIRNALVAATDEMVLALKRSAYSTNIKTRSDFSCAFFDADPGCSGESLCTLFGVCEPPTAGIDIGLGTPCSETDELATGCAR